MLTKAYGVPEHNLCAYEGMVAFSMSSDDCMTECMNFVEGNNYPMGTLLTYVGVTEGDDTAAAGPVTVEPAVDGNQVAGLVAYDVDLTAAGAPSVEAVYVHGKFNQNVVEVALPATWTEGIEIAKQALSLRGIVLETPYYSKP